MSSLFEQIGGEAAIDAAVDLFYLKVLADGRIRHFFVNTDMDKQRAHQRRFLTFALGGMPNYDGRGMTEVHAKLVNEQGLNEDHFNAVAENLQTTLNDLNVPAELSAQVMAVVGSVKGDILAG